MTVPPDVYPNFFCEYDPFPPTAPVYGIVNPNFANVRFPIQEAHVRQHFQNQNEGSARTTTRNKIDENTSWSWVPFTLGFFDFAFWCIATGLNALAIYEFARRRAFIFGTIISALGILLSWRLIQAGDEMRPIGERHSFTRQWRNWSILATLCYVIVVGSFVYVDNVTILENVDFGWPDNHLSEFLAVIALPFCARCFTLGLVCAYLKYS